MPKLHKPPMINLMRHLRGLFDTSTNLRADDLDFERIFTLSPSLMLGVLEKKQGVRRYQTQTKRVLKPQTMGMLARCRL